MQVCNSETVNKSASVIKMDETKKRKAKTSPSDQQPNMGRKARKAKRKVNEKYPPIFTSDEDSEEERGRTPSGSNLSGAVKDMRYFFSPINTEKQGVLQSQSTVNEMQSSDNHVEGVFNHDTGSDNNNNTATCQCEGKCECSAKQKMSDADQTDENETFSTPRMSETEEDIDQENAFLHHLAGVIKTASEEDIKKMMSNESISRDSSLSSSSSINQVESKSSEDLTSPKSQESFNDPADVTMVSSREVNDEENPTVVSAASVAAMFKQLKEEISTKLQNDHTHLRDRLREDMSKIHEVSYKRIKENIDPIIKESTPFKEIQAELNFYKIKSETLSEVCERMYTEISDLTARVENLEVSSSKRMVIMTGLKLIYESKKKETLSFLNDFVNTNLGLDITLDDFFTLGSANPRPIVLILQNIDDKRKILNAKSYLKDIRDEERKIYINEYFPPTSHEKRKRDQEVFEQVRDSNMVAYVRGALTVDGQVYKKQVLPPTPKELINLDPQEMTNVLQLKTKRGAEYTKSNSKFVAYTAPVRTHQDVEKIYKKIKLIKPDARHIVCAYWVTDQETPVQYIKDFHDDGEPGAGRVLLEILEDRNLEGTAIFVARKYGGIKMGADRFTMYGYAAKSVLGIDINTVIEKKRLYRRANYSQGSQRNTQASGQNGRGRGGYRGGKSAPTSAKNGQPIAVNTYSQATSHFVQGQMNNPYRQQFPNRINSLPPHLNRMSAPLPPRAGYPNYPALRQPNYAPRANIYTGRYPRPVMPGNNKYAGPSQYAPEPMHFEFAQPRDVNQPTEDWSEDKEGTWTESETDNKN